MFLVGLPGSGKTYFGKRIETFNNNVKFIDDVSMKGLDSLKNIIEPFVIIADVFLCREEERAVAIKVIKTLFPDCFIEWVFFENNPQKCQNNVKHRNDGRKVESLIEELSKEYVIPEGIETKEIWQNN